MPLRDPRQLPDDEDGAMLPFWGLAFVVVLGMIAMSFDIGRVAVTHSELQSFADQVALAAGGELDGKSDAIERADAAAELMITDSQTFGNADSLLSGSTDFSLTYHDALPPSDATPLGAGTTDPATARFARVDVNAQTVDLTFAAAFDAVSGPREGGITNTVSATAVAGIDLYACDVTPMMFCIPHSGWSAEGNVGQMLELRSGGPGGAWAPGDFGYLDPSKVMVDTGGPCAGLTGSNLDRCLIGAAGFVTRCFSYRGVDIEPGQKVGNLEAALNTRFDIYASSMQSARNDPNYAPAPNVIKGIVPRGGGSCIANQEDPSPNTSGLPLDTCFTSGPGGSNACNGQNGGIGPRFGTGEWNAAGYFAANHAPFDGTVPAAIQSWLTAHAADPDAPTRYEVYRAEAAMSGNILTGTGHDGQPMAETGRPICNTRTNPDIDHSRRVIVVAGIDCAAEGVSGAASNVPVEEFVQIFLTQPASAAGAGNRFSIFGEVVGVAEPSTGPGTSPTGFFRDVVQLYR